MAELGTDLIGGTATLSSGLAAWPLLLSVAALALYALLNDRTENDDDDSTPGGGLMQPVA
jgi:hypothetical protein